VPCADWPSKIGFGGKCLPPTGEAGSAPVCRRPAPRAEELIMDDLLLNQFLLLGAILFCLGVYGVMARKNAVLVLMSIELILNAVNINLIAFGAMHGAVAGSVFALFVIAIAAAEVGVGLAIVLLIYRNRRSVDLDDVAEMKG
jgi:NADH:ubiquinone oxidoreductase subunit K